MQTSLFILVFSIALMCAPTVEYAATIPLPRTPNTAGIASSETIEIETPNFLIGEAHLQEYVPDPVEFPTRITIPSIALDTHVIGVGVNAAGEMDVPDGATNDVGWYEYGTIPGDLGSAVLDAHVYAAFNKLRYVMPGSDIYLTNAAGERLHFRVTDSRVYALDEVPAEALFARESGRYLNLITCARKYIPSLGTYSHRLIVWAELIED